MDAYDENELNAMIESLEDAWKHREEPFHFPSAFHSWFVDNCQDTKPKACCDQFEKGLD